MDPFVAQLHELCRAERTRAEVGHRARPRRSATRSASGSRVEGTSWANLRFTPPLELALADGGAVPGRARHRSGARRARAGADHAAAPRPAARDAELLPPARRAAADGRGAVGDPARAAHGGPHRRRPEARGVREPRQARRAPRPARRATRRTSRRAASPTRRGLPGGPAPPRRLPDPARRRDLGAARPCRAPLERRFLDALPGRRHRPRASRRPASSRPGGSPTSARRSSRSPPRPASDSERLAFLLRPADAPPPRGDGTLALFRAGGREAEVEEVFRRILAAGVPLRPRRDRLRGGDDATLVWEKAQRHDWPVTVEPGVPVALTRPARALLAFCAWVEGGFPAAAPAAAPPVGRRAPRPGRRPDARPGRAAPRALRRDVGPGDLRRGARPLWRATGRGAADPEADDARRATTASARRQVERLAERVAALLAPGARGGRGRRSCRSTRSSSAAARS